MPIESLATRPIVEENFSYHSSRDGVGPLWVTAVYDPTGAELPVVAVMHGYQGRGSDTLETCERLARTGCLALAIDMRGRGDSSGQPDAGGVEILDIYDALIEVIRRLPAQADATNLNIVGYSGGGGNVLSAVTRFPDLFRVAVSYFGISDYGAWHAEAGEQRAARLRAEVGGAPEMVPRRYAARRSASAARNVRYTRTLLFWDAEETLCPPSHQRAFLDEAARHGCGNVQGRESRPGDVRRWRHGMPDDVPDLLAAEEEYLPGIVARAWPVPALAASGTMIATGYLYTRRFRLWLGDGASHVVACEYCLEADGTGAFTLERLTGSADDESGLLSVRALPGALLGLLRDEEPVATAIGRPDGWAHLPLHALTATYRVILMPDPEPRR